MVSFPPVSPPRPYTPPSPHPYAPHAQPISFFSILSAAQYWVRSTNHLAPRYKNSSIPPYLVPPRSKYSPQQGEDIEWQNKSKVKKKWKTVQKRQRSEKKEAERDNFCALCIICRHSDGPFSLRPHNDMTCGWMQRCKHLLPQFTLRLSVKP